MMDQELFKSVASRWARLGVMLNVAPSPRTPDVERLLLDTARVAEDHSRLFILAASWLALYGAYIARHRLARLILDELENEYRPVMGLLLDWAKTHSADGGSRFNLPIAACGKPSDSKPLFAVEQRRPSFARLVRERASPLSLKWGRWMEAFEPKDDALRPMEWIAANNPSLRVRALTGGDLLATVLAECDVKGGTIESEAELARRCAASRPAIREAIRRLRLAGYLRQVKHGRAHALELC